MKEEWTSDLKLKLWDKIIKLNETRILFKIIYQKYLFMREKVQIYIYIYIISGIKFKNTDNVFINITIIFVSNRYSIRYSSSFLNKTLLSLFYLKKFFCSRKYILEREKKKKKEEKIFYEFHFLGGSVDKVVFDSPLREWELYFDIATNGWESSHVTIFFVPQERDKKTTRGHLNDVHWPPRDRNAIVKEAPRQLFVRSVHTRRSSR